MQIRNIAAIVLACLAVSFMTGSTICYCDGSQGPTEGTVGAGSPGGIILQTTYIAPSWCDPKADPEGAIPCEIECWGIDKGWFA